MIKNIVFDLGNVIIDLDVPRTFEDMERLLRHPDQKLEVFAAVEQLIHQYEVDAVSDELFINGIIKYAHPQVYAQQVIRAWNAMLIDIPAERLQFLTQLKSLGYRIFLLSNTNNLHLQWVNQYMLKNYHCNNLDDWFEKSYYSHLIKKRKPTIECFQYVLEDGKMDAAATLFVDDLYANVEGAQSVGIRTLHLQPGHDVITAVKNHLNL